MDLYYTNVSAPCRAVMLTGEALGIKLNLKPINLAKGEQLKEEYLKINPQHTVPTLVDNGFILWESRPIMMYLVEKYGKNDSLYPKDPKSRALVNQRLFFDADLYGKFADYHYPNLFYGKPIDLEKMKPMETFVEYLNIFLETTKWTAADHITIADFAIVATIANYEVLGFDFSPYDFVKDWYNKCQKAMAGYKVNSEGAQAFKNLVKKT